MARRPRPPKPPLLPRPAQPRPPSPGSPALTVVDPARTPPPRKPGDGTGWERTAAVPTVRPECGAPILGPGHVCKPRLDAVSEAWVREYRGLSRFRPFASGRSLGAEVEQELTGDSRPPLPLRPTPHERDGRGDNPQPARPHPGVAA